LRRNGRTVGQADMATSTLLGMLIKNIYTLWGRLTKNIYTLWGRKRLLHCVA